MNKETLPALIEVHNILYRLPVQGENVVPMAQALVTLQDVIRTMAEEIERCEGNPTMAGNIEEVCA